MKFVFPIFLLSLFTINPAFTRFTGLKYLIAWRIGTLHIHHRYYHENRQNYIDRFIKQLKREQAQEAERNKKELMEIIPKIRSAAKNETVMDDNYFLQLKNIFPVTFKFYGQTLTFQLHEYLPEFIFPAIGNATKRPELDHFCVIDDAKSYAVIKKDDSVGLC